MQEVNRVINEKMPQITAYARAQIDHRVRVSFERIKAGIIVEFYNHPVTQELLAGMSDPYGAPNISQTLGGYGNLFSFIGFEEGYNPIDPIIEVLETAHVSSLVLARKGVNVIVQIPEPNDIFDVTPMPWAGGRSWAKGVETGISGLGLFLNKKAPQSRSGGGIQTKLPVRAGRFSNTAYITSFLKKFALKCYEISI